MSKEEKYGVFWKGAKLGDFNVEKILAMYEEGKLGSYHEIFSEKFPQKIFLDEFLRLIGESSQSESCSFEQGDDGITSPCVSEEKKESASFLGQAKSSPLKSASSKLDKETFEAYFFYALCGASFLSLWIYLCALILCMYLFIAGDKKFAGIIVAFSSLMALFGGVFFELIVPVFQS